MAKCVEGCGRNVETDIDMCDVCFAKLNPDVARSIYKQAKQDETSGKIPRPGGFNLVDEVFGKHIKNLINKPPARPKKK